MQHCIQGARVLASKISVKQSQLGDGAGLELLRSKEGPATPSSAYASLFLLSLLYRFIKGEQVVG